MGPESKRVGFLIASEVLGKWVLFSCFSGTVRKLGLYLSWYFLGFHIYGFSILKGYSLVLFMMSYGGFVVFCKFVPL